MRNWASTTAILLILVLTTTTLVAQRAEVRRTSEGKPDFSGTYNAATLTPLERPVAFGDRLFLSKEEAETLAAEARAFDEKALAKTDGDRTAPPEGGSAGIGFEDARAAGEALGAGNVGGYNWFWVDRGKEAMAIDGQFRTSIIVDPPNGRQPAMTERATGIFMEFIKNTMNNDGTAWWLKEEKLGPYDDVELRPTYERCLLGFSEGPPMLPSLYNNYLRVVQTADKVMILNEMIHDARIVRMNSEHVPADMRSWLGDSIGWWEGDTLVVDTTNFRDETGLLVATRDLHLVERFSALDGNNTHYSFTVEDPSTWTASWSGDYVWPKSEERVYEYACHEGNYSLGGIMRGARILEQEFQAGATGD